VVQKRATRNQKKKKKENWPTSGVSQGSPSGGRPNPGFSKGFPKGEPAKGQELDEGQKQKESISVI